jgi:hypothetical protein
MRFNCLTEPRINILIIRASTVCATFDIVALMAKYGNYSFFSEQWAHSICWTYKVLKPYINYRRKTNPRSYPNYSKLYNAAQKHDTLAL